MANIFVALMVMLALMGSAAAQYGPCAGDGSYHLSCYTKTITAQAAIAAKLECFKAWKNPACAPTFKRTYSNLYGCQTAITYSFASDACREAYQAQEKTNKACKAYVKSGLGVATNRLTAKVTSDYKCPTPGPCGKATGAYHLSCYTSAISQVLAKAAKVDCFKAWNSPACKAAVSATYKNTYGCDTAIAYSFATEACRIAYQAQEKTNPNCKVYKAANLVSMTYRLTAFVQADYMCPNPGPCKGPGSYHVSCYAKSITPVNANLAKLDCFKAWNQPKCKATVQIQLSNLFGCDTLIGYSFGTEACRASYQKQEKTNAKCALYNKFGLAKPVNRKNTTLDADYNCAAPVKLG